ncbi:hypothetical protein E2H86_10560 [Pseudomonas putida]|nr:hypothetical protein E2H86_10560 [Pseudomonas putida]
MALMTPSWGKSERRKLWPVGAGLSREWGDAVDGTGFAGVRGTSPLPQISAKSMSCVLFCGWAAKRPRRSRIRSGTAPPSHSGRPPGATARHSPRWSDARRSRSAPTGR